MSEAGKSGGSDGAVDGGTLYTPAELERMRQEAVQAAGKKAEAEQKRVEEEQKAAAAEAKAKAKGTPAVASGPGALARVALCASLMMGSLQQSALQHLIARSGRSLLAHRLYGILS